MVAAIVALVEFSRRHAWWIAGGLAVLVLLVGVAGGRRLAINTDLNALISPDLPWRRTAAELDRQFPQNVDVLAVVIDGDTPDLAGDAADLLAARLSAEPRLFRSVREPGGSEFFRKNGLLFLSVAEVQAFADDMIAAQPLIGTLAADPTLRGVFSALDLVAQGGLRGATDTAALDPAIRAVADAVDAAAAGRYRPISWQNLFSGRTPGPLELRRFVVAQPVLDYSAVQPGRRAVEAIHAAARAANLVPERGVRVRVTGSVALNDDQFAALSASAGWTTVLPVLLLCAWLLLAIRSVRGALAILVVLVAGLVLCAGGAALAIGPFNPISVAFAPLFVGIAIDFGIQFGVRYSAERTAAADAEAMRATTRSLGLPLSVAAGATAVGFFAFVPTPFTGVSDLGRIAGAGMLLALILNLTLLPALLTTLRPRGAPETVGFASGAAADRLVLGHRRSIMGAAAILAIVAAFVVTRLTFDFNPVHLQSARAESVHTLYDLTASAETTPYTVKALEPSPAAAAQLAARWRRLPEVAEVITMDSFVPDDQGPKLEALADAANLLGPTLSPGQLKAAPGPADTVAAIRTCAEDMAKLGHRGDAAAARLAAGLERVLDRGTAGLAAVEANLAAGINRRLDGLRLALQAAPVTLATLPADLRADWIARDGRWCVEARPRGDARDNRVLRRFVDAVRSVAPEATGDAVTVQETAHMVVSAFSLATAAAAAAIAVLLFAVLRRLRDVFNVLAPLVMATLLTLATAVLLGLPLNFANIITVPLLLGIGVAFDIYLVMRWRAGEGGLLASSTARAVVFSALTTGTSFGSLAISPAKQLADMGALLLIALAYILACTVVVLPALLGPPPSRSLPKERP